MHTLKWEGNEVGVDRIGEDYPNSQRFTEECFIERCATFGTRPWNIVSYGKFEAKWCKLAYREDGSRVVRRTADGAIVFEVNLVKNVHGRERVSSVMDILASIESVDDANKQKGSLLHFHQRFGHLNYDTIERIAKLPESGIEIDDHRRLKFLAQKASKQRTDSLGKIPV